jgi:putative transposase
VGAEQQGSLLVWIGRLGEALRNWSDSRNGRRTGRPVGFPRAKKKGRARDACRFTTGQIKVLADRKHVQLPRIGVIKTHESTRKLAGRIQQGTARILAATITRTADRWFVAFTVEVERHLPASNGKAGVVGVDVGVRHLAVVSTGQTVPNPRALEHSLRRLRRLNRELSRRRPDSKRRERTSRRLSRVHARAADVRRDALHKLSAALAVKYGTVVVEHLNVAGMLRNRRLARAISDSGMGELRRTRPGRADRSEARSRHRAPLGQDRHCRRANADCPDRRAMLIRATVLVVDPAFGWAARRQAPQARTSKLLRMPLA